MAKFISRLSSLAIFKLPPHKQCCWPGPLIFADSVVRQLNKYCQRMPLGCIKVLISATTPSLLGPNAGSVRWERSILVGVDAPPGTRDSRYSDFMIRTLDLEGWAGMWVAVGNDSCNGSLRVVDIVRYRRAVARSAGAVTARISALTSGRPSAKLSREF